MSAPSFDLVCPSCRGPLRWSETSAACESETLAFPIREGIPELVLPSSRERVARFLDAYLAVRHAEGWTDDDAALLLALPYRDLSGRHAPLWATRARGYDALGRELRGRFGARRLKVCERGAGVAWLSYRLALDGHEALATDVNVDGRDGLGAARRYLDAGVPIRLAAAEMDRLPLGDASVDVVANAASFHYAVGREAQTAAVAEAARVLAPGGLLAIVDSPVYTSAASGEAMLAEWRVAHPEAAPSGYLVRDEVFDMLRDAGLEPASRSHWMGAAWTVNYARHRLLGPREPARLPLILGAKAPAQQPARIARTTPPYVAT